MTNVTRRGLLLAFALLACTMPAFAQSKDTSLFKIVSVKDEVVIGLSAGEFSALGGNDAGTVAKALVAKVR